MEVTQWTYMNNNFPVISCYKVLCDVNLNYFDARKAVVEELRRRNYHFTGDYHQNGDCGCPIIDDSYSFEVTQREWGDIMAEAFPNEDYSIFDESDIKEGKEVGWSRYLKWAWICDDKWKVPNDN